MTRYLLDSNAVSDFIDRRYGVPERAAEARRRGAVIGTCEPVAAELFFGVENSAKPDDNRRRLKRALAGLRCWPLTRKASEEFGMLVFTLKRTGRLIGPIDMLIAAIARSLGDCIVVTNDSDFQAVPGLKVENWRTQSETSAT